MRPLNGYEKLQQAETAQLARELRSRSRPWSFLRTLSRHLMVYLLALYGLVLLSKSALEVAFPQMMGSYHPYIKYGWVHPPKRKSCACGRTLAEAKANGCHFDAHALAWLPPHCQDLDLLSEWERAGPGPNGEWEYWADQNATIRLTIDEVAELGGKPEGEGWVYLPQMWHIRHCAFAWRKLERSPATGVTVERTQSGLYHLHHCEMEFLREGDRSQITTRAGVWVDADEDETSHMAEEDYWEIPVGNGVSTFS